jgi:hypothetical protein
VGIGPVDRIYWFLCGPGEKNVLVQVPSGKSICFSQDDSNLDGRFTVCLRVP